MSILTDNWFYKLVKTNIEKSKDKPFFKKDWVVFFAVILIAALTFSIATALFSTKAEACELDGRHLSIFVGLGNDTAGSFNRKGVDMSTGVPRLVDIENGNPAGIGDFRFSFERGAWFFPKSMRPVVGYLHMSSAPLEKDGRRVDMLYGGIQWIAPALW
jgi:hypothetical protein